jgi:hypothetical protein
MEGQSRPSVIQGENMEPIILSEDILTQAAAWLGECRSRWNNPQPVIRIGEAVFVSPVDGASNKVVVYLGNGGMPVKGMTLIGIYSADGVRLEEEVVCYPKSGPGGMRVSDAPWGQETNHEATHG